MLVSKAFRQGDILTLKLSSGEEVICRFVEQSESDITITKPLTMTLMQVPNQPGQAAVGFVPFMVGVADDAHIRITRSNIIAFSPAAPNAASGYMRSTSGLEIPTSGAVSNLDLSKLGLKS